MKWKRRIYERGGYNEVEDFEFLKSFIQTTKNAGSKKFIIHARKALLKKLSPKENLNIPPLKYDFVYKLKDFFKNGPPEAVIITSLTFLIFSFSKSL